MTFLSVADCGRHLGIDAKTLRRWLLQAQLPLQPHPSDGRKHGLSEEHLQLLAHLHHRSLSALREAEPATPPPAPSASPLPADLLALPETLVALQAQIAALQQQVTALTLLLQQPAQQPAVPAAAAAPQVTAATLTRPASRSRPTAAAATKPPLKPTHVLPLVEASRDGHYVVICPKQGLLSLEPDSPQWFAWLATLSSFRFVGRHGRLTAHHEVQRVPNGAWRAHRHIRNRSYNLRLGLTQDLTLAVLVQAAASSCQSELEGKRNRGRWMTCCRKRRSRHVLVSPSDLEVH
jgi:hypothetical protein